MPSTNVRNLHESVHRREVRPGQVVAWWLGGAGFIFKTPQGTQLFIDPYLSDAVNAIFGQERAFPPPLTPEQARPDVLICTHWHEDHLDPDALPIIARTNPAAQLLMPPSALARAVSWGVPRSQITVLKAGQSINVRDLHLTAVAARHNAGVEGWEVSDGLCLILEMNGIKIFFSGDTEYDTSLRNLKLPGLHAAFLSMNGVGGNMNAHEAALLAWHWGAQIVVPMHHYLWRHPKPSDDATLDPGQLASTYTRLGGTGKVLPPVVGEEIVLAHPAPHPAAETILGAPGGFRI